jgi:hypothetical protein
MWKINHKNQFIIGSYYLLNFDLNRIAFLHSNKGDLHAA